MKVLTLIDTLYPAGAETLAVSIAELLLKEGGYEPIICATRSGGDLETVLNDRGIRYVVLDRQSKFEIHKMRPLFGMVKEEGVKIVHTHGVGSGIWGVLLARATRVPLVAHVHGGGAFVRWHAVADGFVGRMSARVIAASEFERRRLVDEGLSASRVVAIPNGIDVDRFSVPASVELKSRFGIPHDTPVVGICAALRPEKNHEMFLEAAATVVRDGTRAKFMIVGGGSRVDHLKARARELGIGADCIFTGSIANVPEAMATFDVGVLSSDREGLPLTILEYMAASLPVVATNIAAIPEAVEDGTNGFLVPPGDHRALAERIARLLSDRELAARMGRAGRRIAEDRFSRHAMIAGIKAVYDDALAAQNR